MTAAQRSETPSLLVDAEDAVEKAAPAAAAAHEELGNWKKNIR
jgi:hypothetical protein